MSNYHILGRLFVTGRVEVLTGLHIGGSGGAFEIGGIDNPIIRNPLTNEPYIPGSSLRGKMRSQLEKALRLPQNQTIGQVSIHTCQRPEDYAADGGCPVCHIFGVPAEKDVDGTTRLIVRDVRLTPESAERLRQAHTDLPYSELKSEVAIDRVTAKANPRSLERVPAGAEFGPAEWVYTLYTAADVDRFQHVIEGLQYIEDDYLGGSGARGSGKVRFKDLEVVLRSAGQYSEPKAFKTYLSVQSMADDWPALRQWLLENLPEGS